MEFIFSSIKTIAMVLNYTELTQWLLEELCEDEGGGGGGTGNVIIHITGTLK